MAFVSTARIRDLGQIQINHTLDQVPGIVAARSGGGNAAAPGSITSPNLRGALDYEKSMLLDGHPFINGRFGDYPIMLMTGFVLDGIEIAKGPSANAPSINYAIGGTMNFRTLEPTRERRGELLAGTDSYGGGYENARYSGTATNGRLGFVFDVASYGTRGPLNNYPTYVTLPGGTVINGFGPVSGSTTSKTPVNGATGTYPVPNSLGSPNNAYVTLVACCQNVSSDYLTRAQLAKLRYAFSPVTSAEISYLGIQSSYDNTAGSLALVGSTFAPAASYVAPASGLQRGLFNLNSATQIPNRRLIDSEPVLQFNLSSTYHNDSILARYYTAALDRFTVNPLDSPSANYTTQLYTLYGTATVGGTPQTFTGQQASLTIPTPYFQQAELDQLRGQSFEWDHPIGDNTLSFVFDRTTFLTNAYSVTGSKTNPQGNLAVSIPAGARQDFTTYLWRGNWQLNATTNVTVGNYFNVYRSTFANAKTSSGDFVMQTATKTHDDPRVGVTFRPRPAIAYRLSAGSAVAPPYPGVQNTLNTTAAQVYTPGATSVTIAQNSGALLPETSFGVDIGTDLRLDNGSVFSADLYRTTLFNQFVGTVTPSGTTFTPPGGGAPIPVFISTNQNLAKARFEGVEASLRSAPAAGFGYLVSGALQRAAAIDVNAAFYSGNQNLGVVPGINYAGDNKPFFNSVSNKSEAYAQGYAEMNWRGANDRYASVGVAYYGPNNTYNILPFFVTNATYRLPLGTQFSLQASVDNAFNVDAYRYVTVDNGIGAPLVNGQLGLRNSVPYGPALLHLQLVRRL